MDKAKTGANQTRKAGAQRPGFELRDVGGNLLLELSGRFPVSWAGNLFAALAVNQISVEKGTARRTGPSEWQAQFQLDAARALKAPTSLDFVALAVEPRPVAAGSMLSIQKFSLGGAPGTPLTLEVWGDDQLGFLGRLLNLLAGYSFFPQEMVIGTEGGRIHDRFWLAGIGGKPPTTSAIDSLSRGLERLCGDSPLFKR